MHVGFTGTQRGMTSEQRRKVTSLLVDLGATHFHHGDCIGADDEAHDIARGLGLLVYLHPPEISVKRAFCRIRNNEMSFQVAPYLERNRHIVNTTAALIATPGETEEQLRSGTWSTVRYARKLRRPVYVVFPDGSVSPLAT